ncbi:hypothetical protein U3516DRAFT_759157 [Neocallimastix sp. 'constans']
MEENIRIVISKANRGKKQIIINRKYKFNFSNEKKDNSEVYRCTKYRHGPEFNSIRTHIIKIQNKQLPPDITTFEEIPEESEILQNYSHNIMKIYLQMVHFIFKLSNSIVISPINFNCDFEKEHITNNASESFNNCLKNLFPKKPTFYKLIIVLKKEEGLSTDEIKALIECYKNKKEKLICIGWDDDDIVELWYDRLIHLNNIKH